MDEPIPKIKAKVLKPQKYKNIISKVASTVKKEGYKIAKWIMKQKPQIIKKIPLPPKIIDLITLSQNTAYKNTNKVKHPYKNKLITVGSDIFDELIDHGYIYDKIKNVLVKTSEISNRAFKNKCCTEYHLHIFNESDLIIQWNSILKRQEYLLKKSLKKLNGIKFNTTMSIWMEKDGKLPDEFHFNTTSDRLIVDDNKSIHKVLRNQKEKLMRKIDRFTNHGSGWVVNRISQHAILINKYKPLKGKSFIKLPDWINNKKATINIKNKDDKCFIYCLGRRFAKEPATKDLQLVSNKLKKDCSDQ